MAKCRRCGKETELYEAGIPICVACIDERDKKSDCPKRPSEKKRAKRESDAG